MHVLLACASLCYTCSSAAVLESCAAIEESGLVYSRCCSVG